MVNRLATSIGPTFNCSVDILKGMKMPQEAYNIIRNQHYTQVALAKLEKAKVSRREKVIAVCEEDLYVPEENFVIGADDRIGGTSIVSLYYLRQEFYGLPEDDSKIYPRLFKEAIHRLSHLFGLGECRNAKCVNYYSQLMLDIDSKSDRMCDVCVRSLTGLS